MKRPQWRGKHHAFQQFQLRQIQQQWVHYVSTDLHMEMLEQKRRSVPHIPSSVTVSSLAKEKVEKLKQTK